MSGSEREIFLQPGEHFEGDARYRVRTLLGSCVSIVLWNRKSCVGAISHFLLPGASGLPSHDGRFAEDALALMFGGLRKLGVQPTKCEAKVFGGGDMFPYSRRHPAQRIGRQNGLSARDLLRTHGIPVVAECLFGAGHRQLIFHIATGDVWARQIGTGA